MDKIFSVILISVALHCITLQTVLAGNDGFTQKDRELMIRIDERLNQMDRRFKQVDKRFEQVDKRFEQVDKRFEQIYKQFDIVNTRIEELRADTNKRFEELREDMNNRLAELREDMNKRLAELREDMNKRFEMQDKRFEEQNRRFDTLQQLMTAIIAAFTVIVAVAIGFAIWDRMTTIRRAREDAVQEIEGRWRLGQLMEALRAFAKKNPDFAEILRSFHFF